MSSGGILSAGSIIDLGMASDVLHATPFEIEDYILVQVLSDF